MTTPMTLAALLAVLAETGFPAVRTSASPWTVNAWHPDANARLSAHRKREGWAFVLAYAGQIYVPTPKDARDLIRLLTDTIGADARRQGQMR